MIQNELTSKCVTYNFKELFKKKNYAWFDNGAYNLNIIGIRKFNKNNKATNQFDDVLVIDYNTTQAHKRQIFNITTEPGLYYLTHLANNKGAAILVPNQYRGCWKIGKHNGKYEALCQAKPVTVYRDNNKNDVYDLKPETKDTGMFGINIHRSNQLYTRTTIDQYSAGCQVFNDPADFNTFMGLCKQQMKLYGNSFTYTLLNEEDLI